ncbi:MAG: CoA pyrophosphatase [Planctomycetota bacterium]
MDVTTTDLEKALALAPFDDTAAREEMGFVPRPSRPSRPWRDGAVLVLFYPAEDGFRLVLTRRTATVDHHRSQIAFPGGRREDGESLRDTALRETEEEIGVPRSAIRVLGEMPPFRIPHSGFIVHPFVGVMGSRPEIRIDPREVAEVLEAPLTRLLDPATRAEEEREILGLTALVPWFDLPGFGEPPLWGATAMMLAGLLARIRAVKNGREA